ncbi:MAG: glycerophosphodiester phosphodiesterase [Candidatus Kapaibacterium sp.]
MDNLEKFAMSTDIFVTAHRGASGNAPENTLPAFRKAVEAGARMAEVDVQITSDGRVVAFHDDTLDRTTNAKGPVAERNYDELRSLDAGSWFDKEFAGTKIPSLEEVIDVIKDKLYLNIEVKSYPGGNVTRDLARIVGTVEGAGYAEYTLYSSFDHKLLSAIKTIDPALPTAAIMIPGDERLPSEISRETGSEGFVCSIAQISERIAEDAEKHGIFTAVYPVDTPVQLDLTLRFGVKSIVTNFPGEIIEEMLRIGRMVR